MSRPKIPAEQKRTQFYVAFNPSERQQVEQAAEATGQPISTFIRRAALKETRRERNIVDRGPGKA